MTLAEILGFNPEDPADASSIDMEEARQRLLDQLIAIRTYRGLSVSDVAKELGVSRQAVSKIEHGDRDPRLATLIRYAMAIGAHISMDARREELWFEQTSKARSSLHSKGKPSDEGVAFLSLDGSNTQRWITELNIEDLLLPQLRTCATKHRPEPTSTYTMPAPEFTKESELQYV